jgi:hypothetical protein
MHETTINPALKLIVYNMFHEELRIVVVKPSLKWGNGANGILGVEFGSGFVNDFREVQNVYRRNKLEKSERLDTIEEEEQVKSSPVVKELTLRERTQSTEASAPLEPINPNDQ